MVLFFGRWGMGFLAAGIATYMTWKTAQIRSTQSATGILYITMIFVLFGELCRSCSRAGTGSSARSEKPAPSISGGPNDYNRDASRRGRAGTFIREQGG